jgi:hypothetical protein
MWVWPLATVVEIHALLSSVKLSIAPSKRVAAIQMLMVATLHRIFSSSNEATRPSLGTLPGKGKGKNFCCIIDRRSSSAGLASVIE